MAQSEGIRGDLDTTMPKTEVDPAVLNEEKNLARFSKTAEYKRLKQFLEDRIAYYQNYLPGGQPLKTTDIGEEDLGSYWKIAAIVIGEFKLVLETYENAQEVVDKAVSDATK